MEDKAYQILFHEQSQIEKQRDEVEKNISVLKEKEEVFHHLRQLNRMALEEVHALVKSTNIHYTVAQAEEEWNANYASVHNEWLSEWEELAETKKKLCNRSEELNDEIKKIAREEEERENGFTS